jgi:hypothetical protein
MAEELEPEGNASLQESVGQIKSDLAAFWQTVGPFCRSVDELCKAPIGKDPASEVEYINFDPGLPQDIVDLYDELDEALDSLYDDLDTALGISDDGDGVDATGKIVEAIRKSYPDLDPEILAKAIRSVGAEDDEPDEPDEPEVPGPTAVEPEPEDEV